MPSIRDNLPLSSRSKDERGVFKEGRGGGGGGEACIMHADHPDALLGLLMT